MLTFRASVRVRCWIVLELVGQKGIRHANARKPLLDTSIGLNPRADQCVASRRKLIPIETA
jgi:hypothetical protein